MGLEISDFIDGLNEEWPTSEDFRREGDDHLRLIKGVLKRTFPNIAGEVSLTHTQLNSLLAYVGDVEDNLISTLNLFPTGGIILWSGSIATVPTGWALCDGTNGTPDLRNRFVVGAGDTYAVADVGGAAANTIAASSHSHTITVENHTLTVSEIPGHSHTGWKASRFQRYGGVDTGLVAPGETGHQVSLPEVDPVPDTTLNSTMTNEPVTQAAGGGQGHSHSATSASATIPAVELNNRPPYFALAYIMKLAPTPVTPVDPPGA
jgi:microcystin-dependent protein